VVHRGRVAVLDDTPAVEVVRRLFDAIGDGGEVLAMFQHDVVLKPATRPGRSVYHGYRGVVRLMEDLDHAPNQDHVEIDEFADLGAGCVAVQGHQVPALDEKGTMRGPRVALVMTVRDGLIVRSEGWMLADDPPL
jgi:ketosteroid isomerase-like protein